MDEDARTNPPAGARPGACKRSIDVDRPRLFLVDGYALAYRAYYAMIERPLRTSFGEMTSVSWGVTLFLRKLIAEHVPTHLAVVLDAGDSFRAQLYPEYKATRDKLGAIDTLDFDASMERVRQLLDAFRIPVIEIEGWEADDVLGTLAAQAVAAGAEAVIVSGDTDFYQLIGAGISVIDPGRRGRALIEPQWVDAAQAAVRLGVRPSLVVDYLALTGDPSDNVPGIRGIGPKTAAALLERFGSLDAVLANLDSVTPTRAKNALVGHEEQARLSRLLVTIRRDAPVKLDLAALERREPDRERLRELFVELEFHTLLHELAPAAARQPLCQLCPDADELARFVESARTVGHVALWPIAERRRAPLGLAMAIEEGRVLYLALPGGGIPAFAALDAPELAPLRELLISEDVLKVGHDLKHALLSLRAAGVTLAGPLLDTMLAAYCVNPGRRRYDLEALVIEHLGHSLRWEELDAARLAIETPERLVPHAAERADASLCLSHRLLELLDRYGQRRLFDELETPLVPVLADMEAAGVAVDLPVLEALGRELDLQLARVRRQIFTLAGGQINLDSPAQLREVLFERLRLPVKKRTKSGPSTDADVLEELAAEGHPLPVLLLEYRELAKLRSTYVEGLRGVIDPRDGRLHTTFNQAITATGRLSSSDPNLQNIPVKSELGATIRKAFVAAQDHVLLGADYSQIELRILAHLSGEPAFIEAFAAGRDVHRETAARVYGVALSRVTPEMRTTAKMVNYATIYGQGARSLAQRLGMPLAQAERFIDDYFGSFPRIRTYLDEAIAFASANGYVETLFGRRRYIPELRSRNPSVRGFGTRVARNTPVQGSAADIIKIAMIRIHAELARHGAARMLLQVHDELLFEVERGALAVVREMVRHEMEGVTELAVPLVVDFGAGPTWYHTKRVEPAERPGLEPYSEAR